MPLIQHHNDRNTSASASHEPPLTLDLTWFFFINLKQLHVDTLKHFFLNIDAKFREAIWEEKEQMPLIQHNSGKNTSDKMLH
jgi:hypothetical protein